MLKNTLIFFSILLIQACGNNTTLQNLPSHLEPYYYQQWYLDKNETFYEENSINSEAHIHPDDLLDTYNGKGIKIAVIDDGLDTTHEDLAGAVTNTYDLKTKTANVTHNDVEEHHGTSVTGIIGARVNSKGIKGIASGSEIIFLKYKETMKDSETIELFNAADHFGADIINCSWGTYDVSEAVKYRIQELSTKGRDGRGSLIVFASGNDEQDMGNDESAIPEVIGVGASDEENLRAWYSNYGENLDILAPGGYYTGLTTLDDMGSRGAASLDENYILYNDLNAFAGTSASAPIVSGIIALMLEADPDLTHNEVEYILRYSSDKIGNVAYINGRNDYYGYGKVNLSAIMEMIRK